MMIDGMLDLAVVLEDEEGEDGSALTRQRLKMMGKMMEMVKMMWWRRGEIWRWWRERMAAERQAGGMVKVSDEVGGRRW